MQMEKYHRLLIKKLKAEASHDYEQYAEAVASLDGFEVRACVRESIGHSVSEQTHERELCTSDLIPHSPVLPIFPSSLSQHMPYTST